MKTIAARLLPSSIRNRFRPAYQLALLSVRDPRTFRFIVSHRLKGRSISDKVTVGKLAPDLTGEGRISIGACSFGGQGQRSVIKVRAGALLEIYGKCVINDGFRLECTKLIIIGKDTLIGSNVTVLDNNFHRSAPTDEVKSAPVIIGRNVWISSNAVILPGVTIGDHPIIGAGSVVTHSIPDKTFAAGSPCKPIRALAIPDDWVRGGE